LRMQSVVSYTFLNKVFARTLFGGLILEGGSE
jgi:hypothetical protein